MPWTGSPEQLALVQLVEFRADQLTATGQTIGVNQERIYAELETATRKLLRTGKAEVLFELITDGSTFANANLVGTTEKIRIPMPDGTGAEPRFLRYLRTELSYLYAPLDVLRPASSSEYRLQANPNSRSDVYDPRAFLVPHSGFYAVEIFPGSTASTPVTQFWYLGETAPEALPAELKDYVTYEATAMVLVNERRPQEAQIAQQAAQAYLQAIKVGMIYEEPTQTATGERGAPR